jgi:hypothetical protein
MLFALVPINQLSSDYTRIDGTVFTGTPGMRSSARITWYTECAERGTVCIFRGSTVSSEISELQPGITCWD